MVAVDTDLFKHIETYEYKPLAISGFDGPYVKDGKTKYITADTRVCTTGCPQLSSIL
jgi:hypothetical protein